MRPDSRAHASFLSWLWSSPSSCSFAARLRSILAKLLNCSWAFAHGAVAYSTIVVVFCRQQTALEAEPKHIPLDVGVEAYEEEREGLGRGVVQEAQHGLRGVDPTKLLT